MNIEIVCIGKLKEKYWTEAAAEYSKRLGRFCALKVTELAEERLPAEASAAQEQAVVDAESERIAAHMAKAGKGYTVALAIKGRPMSSEELSNKIESIGLSGVGRIYFIIGGSLGLSQGLIDSCDLSLSFSSMTFPHQMMRIILLEQIYRAFKISAGEKYHK